MAERKEAYLAALPGKPSASLLVSLADETYNARAIVDNLAVHGEAPRARCDGGRASLCNRVLARIFRAALPGPGAECLTAVVDEMHRLAEKPTG